jgi:hypothetical protein
LVWSGSTVLAIESETAVVDIHSRAFLPHRLLLHHGRPTVLAIKNHDTELHAFVPAGLLSGVNVNVSGNGAPEFGSQGFKRGIIPPDGVMEIQFTPERRGEFPYVCDMPGHQMTATIVVE